MFDAIQTEIQQAVAAAAGEEAAAALDFGSIPAEQKGDLAVVTFPLARLLRQAPNRIANTLVEPLQALDFVKEVQAVGAYANLTFDRKVIATRLRTAIATGAHFGFEDGKGRRVLLEHTSINPNASPHVGRARNGIIGDTLARVIRKLGYEVEVHYYVNNMGKQIALLARACRSLERDPAFDELLQIYTEASQEAEGNSAVEQEAFQMLQAFEDGDSAIREEFTRVVRLCLDGQTAILARLGIAFDRFDEESDFIQSERLDEVIRALETTGALFRDEDERYVVDLAKLGYDKEHGRHLVLRRSNGSSMYVLRDLAYTCYKADRGAELNLTVLGEDHHLYQEQLSYLLQKTIGCQVPDALFYSFVLLKDGKMSTRRGRVVLLNDLLNEAEERVAARLLENRPELDAEARLEVSRKVAAAAIRFTIARVGPGSNVTFDIEEALSFEGDTGPYLQYTFARLSSLLDKASDRRQDVEPDWSLLSEAEWHVLMELARFRERVRETYAARNPAHLCMYALSLAKLTNRFYHGSPVLQAEDQLFHLRTELSSMARATLGEVLHLIGLETSDRI